MPEEEEVKSPALLSSLLLMMGAGTLLFIFFAFNRGCGMKTDVKPVADVPTKTPTPQNPVEPKPQPSPAEIAKTVADANQTRPRQQPVLADPQEQERTRQLLLETTPRKPFTTLPQEFRGQPAIASATPAEPMGAEAPAVPEPVREVAAASAEGAALVADATARVEEAPSELYSDKAKAKVREGLSNARRIFKVHTVFFEKGGAVTQAKDVQHLKSALETQSLQDVMADPRAVFFVLGFADKTGAPDTNKKLSIARADAIIGLLRDDCGVLNFTYPVAVGSTELVAPANKEKNRAAEVWLVLP
ncbi:MAG: hypothetical protein ACOYMN_03680 [Roseimicrobium sp.]